ncbi:MAG TPA: hypothetical protein VF723_03505 [Pyrinomonadaceae bacterium]|jgi:hypothetical protein
MTNATGQERCPRCGQGRLRGWLELDDEEREVVRRLHGSALYTPQERAATHRWCTHCWHELTVSRRHDA